MSWTKKDQAKLREYQTAQMTVKEIAVKMQRPPELIRAELEAMGYRPIESKPVPESEFLKGREPVAIPYTPDKRSYQKTSPEMREKFIELRMAGRTYQQIANLTGVKMTTVKSAVMKYLKEQAQKQIKEDKPVKINEEFEAAVNEMMAEAKEEEPAPVAADTSSKQEITPVISTTNNTIRTKKSQALSGVKMIGVLDDLLNDLFGENAEVVSMVADAEHCDIGFAYQGREYSIFFAQREEVPEYDRADRR